MRIMNLPFDSRSCRLAVTFFLVVLVVGTVMVIPSSVSASNDAIQDPSANTNLKDAGVNDPTDSNGGNDTTNDAGGNDAIQDPSANTNLNDAGVNDPTGGDEDANMNELNKLNNATVSFKKVPDNINATKKSCSTSANPCYGTDQDDDMKGDRGNNFMYGKNGTTKCTVNVVMTKCTATKELTK